MNKTCPNYDNCAMFNGQLITNDFIVRIFKQKYCNEKHENWHLCKRYQVKESYGECPNEILPDSILSLNEIKTRYNLEETLPALTS